MRSPFESAPHAKEHSRRTFLSATAGGALASVFSRPEPGGVSRAAANERINLAGIGVGGMGGGDIATLARLGVNVVALCDVDDKRAAGSDTGHFYPAVTVVGNFLDFPAWVL
jgi:hypothetical protein